MAEKESRGPAALRLLYESMGYRKFKMSRFEDYELYLENKSFLPAGGIVTFSGKGGRLLALKPDVTLSILCSVTGEGLPRRLYYSENVYRADKSGELRERRQVGLEYVGEADICAMGEVLLLACESLAAISDEYILDLSHMGLVTGLLAETGLREGAQSEALHLIAGKNSHELRRLLAREGVTGEAAELLPDLAALSGRFEDVLPEAERFAVNGTARDALRELEGLGRALAGVTDVSKLRLDFSIVNDMHYYNGLIFRGYIPELPEGVLAGGRYDKLAQRVSGAPGAVGFAVYTDLLERLGRSEPEYDADVAIVSNGCAAGALRKACELRNAGKSVMIDGGGRCRETIEL